MQRGISSFSQSLDVSTLIQFVQRKKIKGERRREEEESEEKGKLLLEGCRQQQQQQNGLRKGERK